MKLFQKLAEEQFAPPAIKTPRREAEKLFASGVKNHQKFNLGIKSAREGAIKAGFDFWLAKPAFEHGTWERHCQNYQHEISLRSIQLYMELAEVTYRWVRYKNPAVLDMDEIRALALELVLVTPKPLVELCRELEHVMDFGGYYIDDYEDDKKRMLLAGGQQVEFKFEFAPIARALDRLTHFGDEKYLFAFPDGADEKQFISAMKDKLKLALKRVEEIEKNGRVIES